MLSRAARPAIAQLSTRNGLTVGQAGRTMATLREIEQRLKSIRNIEKITKTMKVVASTKLTHATRAMQTARLYGTTNSEVFRQAETAAPSSSAKTLYITVSSDKGLCGGIHSSLSRATRRISAEEADENASFGLVVIGDKSKQQLSRAMPEKMVLTFNQIGKDVPTFNEAQAVADQIFAADVEFDRIEIIYNKFVSMVSYEAAKITVFSESVFQKSPKFAAYEIEDDVLANLKEFALANAVYWALVEGHACEISARQNAMDNASKNAGDMINKFSLLYNRTRQAVITTELVDIVTGASAV